MKKTFNILIILFFIGSTVSGALATEYFANSSEDIIFTYGVPCSKLVDLSEAEVFAVVHPSHKEEFENFCVPEDVYNCSDYNGLLYQLGTLERHDGVLCRYVPNKN